MANKKECYYIVDTCYDPQLYIARNDKAFMNYFIENIDEFKDLFESMHLTNSKFKKKFPKVYETPFAKYDIYNDEDWDHCKKKFCNYLQGMSFQEFVDELNGSCNDGNATPYISIKKRDKSSVTFIQI